MHTNTNNISQSVVTWAKEYWPSILILLAIVGFVSKSLYNYPVSIMAILGFYKLVTSPKILIQERTLKVFSLSFLCLWLPLLLSLPDAANPVHSAHTVFPYLRFFFAGIFIIDKISKDEKNIRLIVYSIFFIVCFWCIDASFQFFIGYNLLGYPYDPFQGITGVFYPKNKIAHICSILSVFCFIAVFVYTHTQKWWPLLLLPIFFVVLISGRRAAWIMLILSSVGFFAYLYVYSINKKQILKFTAITAFIISLILSATIIFDKTTNIRFTKTLGLFSADFKTFDAATAGRLSLWKTGYKIFKSNPINGIGPRGYRHVFHDYAAPDNIWYTDLPQTHPHLLLLEILIETGLIGLAGYIFLLFILLKDIFSRGHLKSDFPFFLPVLVALFPLNAHMAFYGSIWSTMSWLLISLYFSHSKIVIRNRHNNIKPA